MKFTKKEIEELKTIRDHLWIEADNLDKLKSERDKAPFKTIESELLFNLMCEIYQTTSLITIIIDEVEE